MSMPPSHSGSLPVDLTRLPLTDPLEIYRYRDGLYAVDLLTAALTEWDFFTWLAARPSSLGDICRELKLAERPVDVMITLFTASGYVASNKGVFELTPLAREHLVSDSPWFIGPYFAALKDRPVVKDYIAVLRTGRPANWGSYQHEKAWSEAMLTESFSTSFTAAMDCRGAYLAPALAARLELGGRRRLLDVAGGSGIYACAMVARHANLSATVFERPPVDVIARTMIRKRGYEDRVSVAAGDMFAEPFPVGHDIHLFSNVLHDWDFPKVRALLAASFQALEPGGLLVVHDVHLNAEKTGPLPAAKYSALLMNITEGKCYSIAEMDKLLKDAGFQDITFTENVADRSFICARKPV